MVAQVGMRRTKELLQEISVASSRQIMGISLLLEPVPRFQLIKEQHGQGLPQFRITALIMFFFKITLNSTTTPTSGAATLIDLSSLGTINGLNAVGYLNGKVYVSWYGNSGPGNLSFSSNGGTSWTTTSGVSSGRIDADPVNNYLFVTGSNGNSDYTINLTRDGGSTFISSSINTSSNSYFYGINLSSSGIAYAGLTNSSIYATTGT